MLEDDNDTPPTSEEEAAARGVRPPLEKYDPDKHSRWSITMTVAWIIWRDLDAVRDEWDDYREKCADWKLDPGAAARAKLLIPDLQEGLQKESPWHLCSRKPSGWNTLPDSEHMRRRVARDELWQAAGEGGIKAIAREYKNAKAILGDPIEIPSRYWPYLKHTDDPLTGMAMLSDDNGRIYRKVLFPRLKIKELWPRSPLLPEESREHKKKAGPQQRRILPVLAKLFPPDGKVPDDVPTETVRGQVNEELASETKLLGLPETSWDSVNRALGREPPRR